MVLGFLKLHIRAFIITGIKIHYTFPEFVLFYQKKIILNRYSKNTS